MNKSHIKLLKENYEKACNDYAKALMEQWGLDTVLCYWVADEVGGVYDYNGWLFFNMSDIVYCVENNVSLDEYDAWQDYNIEATNFGFDHINLKSWCNGCPRLSEAQIKTLHNMHKEIDDLCEEYKNNITTTEF